VDYDILSFCLYTVIVFLPYLTVFCIFQKPAAPVKKAPAKESESSESDSDDESDEVSAGLLG
jgi:hypothetical protein